MPRYGKRRRYRRKRYNKKYMSRFLRAMLRLGRVRTSKGQSFGILTAGAGKQDAITVPLSARIDEIYNLLNRKGKEGEIWPKGFAFTIGAATVSSATHANFYHLGTIRKYTFKNQMNCPIEAIFYKVQYKKSFCSGELGSAASQAAFENFLMNAPVVLWNEYIGHQVSTGTTASEFVGVQSNAPSTVDLTGDYDAKDMETDPQDVQGEDVEDDANEGGLPSGYEQHKYYGSGPGSSKYFREYINVIKVQKVVMRTNQLVNISHISKKMRKYDAEELKAFANAYQGASSNVGAGARIHRKGDVDVMVVVRGLPGVRTITAADVTEDKAQIGWESGVHEPAVATLNSNIVTTSPASLVWTHQIYHKVGWMPTGGYPQHSYGSRFYYPTGTYEVDADGADAHLSLSTFNATKVDS
ncbi:hypothetical protein [Circoviridae 14 LDMD-2013]|uniref:hypothetical protein n=1 Tax=Circoviridae 14 LDMD-2013 TaxID=1379718 RepID=UPI0003845930|nr:hypothetical protein [Circoviridae 14 LDMD-2013]AGS36222.1 hypothetical protein [Circoviridae 14 LDMD-2013]